MAAGAIKGITIEFRGKTTPLDRALQKINKETRTVDQQLRQVNWALKFNPTSAELLRQKFTLLKELVQVLDYCEEWNRMHEPEEPEKKRETNEERRMMSQAEINAFLG